ncbi:MAG: HlyD family efflux transporter periplasmic adaptor subunit [Pseudomonadota bacterium]
MKRALAVLAALVAVGFVVWWFALRARPAPQNVLSVSGHIEATETDLSFKVSGKIAAIYFQEGDGVRRGQLVAEMEGRDLRDDVRIAQAAAAFAQANLARLQAGSRPQEIAEAKAAVDQARADLRNKQLEYDRNRQLFAEGVVPASRLDNSRAAWQVAQQALNQIQERYRLVRIGPRQEDIDAARAEYGRAEANLDLAKTRLGYARLTAPVDGVVLVREAEPGEVVAVGATVLTTGDLGHAYLEAYVPETDLTRVHYGQRAAIATDTYPGGVYPGFVYFVSSKAEFTPKTVETRKERVTLVYRTKIRVYNPRYELKAGMPADGVIYLDGARR